MNALRILLTAALLATLIAPSGVAHGLPSVSFDPTRSGLPVKTAPAIPALDASTGIVVAPTSDAPAARWQPSASAGASPPYGVRFKCAGDLTTSGGGSGGGEVGVVNSQFCPSLVWDPFDLMSQPVFVVDPRNPVLHGFNALHGAHGIPVPASGGPRALTPPPSERSRTNELHEPHTTFTSTNMGRGWDDNPYFAPVALAIEGRRVFGEDNAAVLDANGRLYVASLYAYQDPSDSAYKYAITLWKFNHLNEPLGYFDSPVILKPDGYNKIDSLFMVYSKEADRVVVLWRESYDNKTLTKSPKSSWINITTTVPGDSATWERMSDTAQIGPCKDISNPLAFGGLVYVGCQPDAGYETNANSSVDYMQIHSIDPLSGSNSHVAPTPYSAGHVLLLRRADGGHMILINSGVSATGKPFVKVSYGAVGGRWGNPADYGHEFVKAPKGVAVVDARITAAAFTKTTGYIHLIYTERYKEDGKDPAKASAHTIYKTYAVIRPNSGFQGEFNLGYGNTTGRVPWGVERQGGVSEGIFFDLHDSIVVWEHPRTHKERIFTAFGDFGYIRHGEIVEEYALPAIPLPPIGAPPVPLAIEAGNAASTGAAAGALAALMLLRLLAAKKAAKTTVTA